MDEEYYIDDTNIDRSKGRYAVFDDDGELVAQDDDLNVATAAARAKGVKVPAILDLELAEDKVYVF